ncbi:Pre-mRNA-splicing factor RSE1 [Jaminaea rosea]|uniref:Pre-mRNA-splicing factor RSE1 n=1 Tax=Jaminaea rosea TaxID=1569628 RepID=A0A316UT21_9BASI|nr:Pre-mRNA-splicing factor RSE1 [Jaminaea rosea]PWN27033.1 Pre-mRNA-splicing factor RSE1 [Jaminaea rosea]
MHLYNLTLSPPSAATVAVAGQFSGTRKQEIVVCRGGCKLELLRPDTTVSGKAHAIFEQHTFGVVRSLASFRLTGGSKDYLIVGSDSGRITIAELDVKANAFVVVHQETFGRSGSRRIVPGQYIATDPKGRAAMIGAMEKSKLVYILNRDAAANLTISSPLEAHKPNAIIHALVGLDVGYENPTFAALEVDYEEADRDSTGEAAEATQKLLTYYELDLGLNHVVRRWSSPVEKTANHLVQVPGGYNQNTERWEGPGGVLVCSEDYITYKHSVGEEHRVPMPRRLNPLDDNGASSSSSAPRRGNIVVSSVCHRMKNAFFFLLQNEDGDLFKLTIDHQDEDVRALKIKYFDTVPLASSLVILRAGFLFVAAEFGGSALYSFQKLGDDDEVPTYSSADLPELGMTEVKVEPPTFTPRPLDNLLLTDDLPALDPILDAKVLNLLGGDTPQIFTLCGRGPRSTFKMLQHGLEVQEAVSSDLPGIPNAIWTTKLSEQDEYDSYIVLSFVNGTLVLSIGETIEEVSDSGFLTSAPTLAVQQLGASALLQVHPKGIRHIMADRRVVEWAAPPMPDGEQTSIVAAATNSRQVVVALAPTNEIVYFEQDLDGQLNEYQERKSMGAPIVALSIGDVPQGRQRTPYLAVGCEDQTVRIVSLDPESTLSPISIQALTAPPHSICIAEMQDVTVDRNHPTLFVNIGLKNGVLLRTVLDPISGQLTDTRTRFLGAKPVRLVRIKLQGGAPAVLALSSRPWLNYAHQARTHFTPLCFDALDHAWTFSAEMCPDGLIGIVGGSLRIFTVPTLGTKLKADSVALSYTPRRMVAHPDGSGLFYIAEADHRTLSPSEKEKRIASLTREPKVGERGVLDLDPVEFGPLRAEAGNWASCIRVVDAKARETTHVVELEGNEAAFNVALVPFANSIDPTTGQPEIFLIVSSARAATVTPRSHAQAFLTTYRLVAGSNGRTLELLHKTEVDDVALALRPFQGRLLAGVGKALRIYDLGKKKLLRKVENRNFPTAIVALDTQGPTRIVVGDAQESTFFVSYKAGMTTGVAAGDPAGQQPRLVIFADDTVPRWISGASAMLMLDYDTVIAGDKFGNVFVNRVPSQASHDVDEDPTGLTVLHEKPFLQGAPTKCELLAHFHVGDVVTSLQRAALSPGGREAVVYTCLGGTVGVLVPFASREDVEMLSTLEMHMRTTSPSSSSSGPSATAPGSASCSLVGRDHLAYRGSYVPVKACVDGDLCETFGLLAHQRQAGIAEGLEGERTPADVNKKLEALRIGSAF